MTTNSNSETPNIHIIGAGLAGLAAAVRLSHLEGQITIYESAPRAGGRCRSYHDPQLGCVVDNGNHMIMSGNHAVMEYLNDIGTSDRLAGPSRAVFPFVDVSSGQRWALEPNAGAIPWWVLATNRRVPGTTIRDYLSTLKILTSNADNTVAECVSTKSPLYKNFWEPLTVAALNTDPKSAAAGLMRPVLTETFLKGAKACRPLMARTSLAETLVEPAIALLKSRGAEVRFSTRIKSLRYRDNAVDALVTESGDVEISPSDVVVLAVPSWIADSLVPGVEAPSAGEPIVNVHYKLADTPSGADQVQIIGIVNGLSQWVFVRDDLASVTISAAAETVDKPAEEISALCWREVALALGLSGDEPPSRVVKERRATFAQTPDAVKKRPETRTNYANLLLAGDWTATGVPATIEGAVRSGFRAAAAAEKHLKLAPLAHSTKKQIKAA